MDGRIILGKVDCTLEGDLCKRYIFLDSNSKFQADFLYTKQSQGSRQMLLHPLC